MTTRRQDSRETWGNNSSGIRSQGNVTNRGKKTTIGNMLVSQASSNDFDRQKENFQRRKRDPNKSPGQARAEEAVRIISGSSLVPTVDDGRRMC